MVLIQLRMVGKINKPLKTRLSLFFKTSFMLIHSEHTEPRLWQRKWGRFLLNNAYFSQYFLSEMLWLLQGRQRRTSKGQTLPYASKAWILDTLVLLAWLSKYWLPNECYSAIKNNEIMPFAATWMDREIIILSEVSQKEKDKYHVIPLFVESQIWHKWTCLWNRSRLTEIENRLVVAMGEGWIERLGLADANYYI